MATQSLEIRKIWPNLSVFWQLSVVYEQIEAIIWHFITAAVCSVHIGPYWSYMTSAALHFMVRIIFASSAAQRLLYVPPRAASQPAAGLAAAVQGRCAASESVYALFPENHGLH